jgi:hypothetical protein
MEGNIKAEAIGTAGFGLSRQVMFHFSKVSF